MVRQAWAGAVHWGAARHGEAGLERRGWERLRLAWRGRLGAARCVLALRGGARQAWLCGASRG